MDSRQASLSIHRYPCGNVKLGVERDHALF
jgi:hypothetical protein